MDTRFVKKILKATEDLDTLVYVSSISFEEAIIKWLKDFSKALNSVADTFEPLLIIKIGASTFEEKRIEQIHQEFLNRLTDYVEGVDLVFARKALQYSKIAVKLNGPKKISEQVLKDIKDAEEYLLNFEKSIARIRKFSQKQMQIAKSKKLQSILKYKYQFERLSLFEKLTIDLAIKLLKEKAEI